MAIPLGRPSPDASRDPDPDGNPETGRAPSYLVLLPVGLARAASVAGPPACALARTVSPLPRPGFENPGTARAVWVFCGAIPGVRRRTYPAPCLRGARTFLQLLAQPAAIRPSDAKLSYHRRTHSARGLKQVPFDCGECVEFGGVEQRDFRVLCTNEQRKFGAAQN